MKQTKKTTVNNAVKVDVPTEIKKSKIALFLENKPNVGTIVNMRAILK